MVRKVNLTGKAAKELGGNVMSFINYEILAKTYHAGRMKRNMQLLKEMDVFHCLLAGNSKRVLAVKKRVENLPDDFLKWLEVCDGGMLFDTVILTTKSHDDELNLDFFTYGDLADIELRKGMNFPDDWFVFAIAVHSDVFFFDMKKKDGQVYQWDVEERKIYAFWHNFEDWLSDQIHEATELIAEEILYPMSIKMEMIGNE